MAGAFALALRFHGRGPLKGVIYRASGCMTEIRDLSTLRGFVFLRNQCLHQGGCFPITKINRSCFENCHYISICVARNIIIIRDSSFADGDFSALSFEFLSHLQIIERDAFAFIRRLKSISLPNFRSMNDDCAGFFSCSELSGTFGFDSAPGFLSESNYPNWSHGFGFESPSFLSEIGDTAFFTAHWSKYISPQMSLFLVGHVFSPARHFHM
jgi:hypothetical protein